MSIKIKCMSNFSFVFFNMYIKILIISVSCICNYLKFNFNLYGLFFIYCLNDNFFLKGIIDLLILIFLLGIYLERIVYFIKYVFYFVKIVILLFYCFRKI